MLFPCLKCHAECTVTLCVNAYSNDTTWNIAFEIIFRGKEGGVRPTITKWNTKALGCAKGYICPQFAGRRKQGKGKQVSCHRYIAARIVYGAYKVSVVLNAA